MNNTKGWILTIGILVILALGFLGILRIFENSLNATVGPVQEMTGDLGTRVAEVLNPTPTILPDLVSIVHKVASLARLETIQYSIERVIRAENSRGILDPLLGEKLLFVAHGNVIAGIDLGKLKSQDIWLDEGVLYVRIPMPEVFVATLDNQKSYVYDRETGLFSKGDIHLETTVRQIAEKDILQAAIDDGVLTLASQNAEAYLERLFEQLGFREIVFSRDTSTPVP